MTTGLTSSAGFNYEKVGRVFKSARGNRSLKDISDQTGISPSFIFYIEKGSKAWSIETFVKLAHYYQLNAGDLLESGIPPESSAWLLAEAQDQKIAQRDADDALHEFRLLLTDMLIVLDGCGQSATDKTGRHMTREVLISAHGLLLRNLDKIDISGMTSGLKREEAATLAQSASTPSATESNN